MEFPITLSPALKGLNPPRRMIEILQITDETERNRQAALWACEYGFDELRPKPYPTRTEKVREYYALSPIERKKRNNNAGDYHKFWNDPEVWKFFNDYNIIKGINRNNKLWLSEIKSWLDPARDIKQISLINDRVLDFGDEVREADWHDTETQ